MSSSTERSRKFRENNPGYDRNWRIANPDKIRTHDLKERYGITLEDYDKLLLAQDNKCGICKQERPINKNLDVDHNHKTDEVRGLLCRNCNRGLGYFKEAETALQSAIDYLRSSNVK